MASALSCEAMTDHPHGYQPPPVEQAAEAAEAEQADVTAEKTAETTATDEVTALTGDATPAVEGDTVNVIANAGQSLVGVGRMWATHHYSVPDTPEVRARIAQGLLSLDPS
jgi:hypothetical protein